jgi:hypothetical protein
MPSRCNFVALKTTLQAFLFIKNYPEGAEGCEISSCRTHPSPNNCQLFVNKRPKKGKSTVAPADNPGVFTGEFFCTKVLLAAVTGFRKRAARQGMWPPYWCTRLSKSPATAGFRKFLTASLCWHIAGPRKINAAISV